MKRILFGILCVMLMATVFNSCKKEVQTAPPPEPEKVVEKVEEPAPKVEKPQLTEEEIFQRRTLEELNRMGHLKRIHFDFDKYVILDDMKATLEQNARWLLKYPSVEIRIGGHCDERGTEEYNMALGEKRANAARQYMVSLGVESGRIHTVSYGKTQPLVRGVDEESHYQNRRAEFTITKK